MIYLNFSTTKNPIGKRKTLLRNESGKLNREKSSKSIRFKEDIEDIDDKEKTEENLSKNPKQENNNNEGKKPESKRMNMNSLLEIQNQLKNRTTQKAQKKDEEKPKPVELKKPNINKKDLLNLSIKQRREMLTKNDISSSDSDESDWSS